MSDDNSGPDKATDQREESLDTDTDADPDANAETVSTDSTSPTSIEADLGASALVELDAVDIEQGTISTRTLTTGEDDPFGIELGLEVGPAQTEVVLDPEATAALADELADAVETFEEAERR
jgi:hypothetical protein